jgi:ribonucleoside-diphosphate reductase alpha chain
MKRMIAEGEAVKAKEMAMDDAKNLKLWARVMRKRKESGYPYLFFTDNVNNNKPKVLKDKNIKIYASNLCSEICLPSNEDESFVCNLASMNILTYDEWKNTDAVEVMTYFLDAVMTDYIEKTSKIPFMESSCNFARRWRALGIGQLGWHTYLQSKMIPFESFQAMNLTAEIRKFMDERSLKASKEMAARYGEPEGLLGYGVRNLTRLAVAPTTSSSFILGQVSPSIEPLRSNYFTKDLAKGSFTYKNPYLAKVLESYGKNNDDVWYSILTHKGSVQHLDFLGETEKQVFKTFDEIVPLVIVQQAAVRQKYIDQAQSLNLLIPPNAPPRDVNALIIEGWKLGIKTFYYQRSSNPSQDLVNDIMNCVSCEA